MAEPAKSGGLRGWLSRQIPQRHTIHHNWLLRPFARHLAQPNLWHLNHRSIPRAVAIGLGVGIIIPVMHIVVAALAAVPARANVMIAAACTLVVNPLTMPPIYYAALRIGQWELHQDAMVNQHAAEQVSGELNRMLFWIHEASGPIAIGILTLALGAAAAGYAFSALGWRWWVSSRWRRRRDERRLARQSQ
jgi:uncharacterized protein (DUF2062 family)